MTLAEIIDRIDIVVVRGTPLRRFTSTLTTADGRPRFLYQPTDGDPRYTCWCKSAAAAIRLMKDRARAAARGGVQ